jgi:broad specificity phosphatase PhoE
MIIFVRHGSTAINESGHVQGHQDPDLSPLGHQEVVDLRNRLVAHGVRPAVVASSPSVRAMATAKLILEVIPGGRLRVSPAYSERDYGRFDGLGVPELIAARQEAGLSLDDIRQDWSGIDEVESDESVAHRVLAGLSSDGLMAAADGGDAVVVTHRGVMKSLLTFVLSISPARPHPVLLPTCSALGFVRESGWLELALLWADTAFKN